jgi:hypothetical protein
MACGKGDLASGIHVAFGQQGATLFPDGLLLNVWCHAGMKTLLRIGELRELPE